MRRLAKAHIHPFFWPPPRSHAEAVQRRITLALHRWGGRVRLWGRRRRAQRACACACREVLGFLCPGAQIGRCVLCSRGDCLFKISPGTKRDLQRKGMVAATMIAKPETGDGLARIAE